jgi:hypothetical protein
MIFFIVRIVVVVIKGYDFKGTIIPPSISTTDHILMFRYRMYTGGLVPGGEVSQAVSVARSATVGWIKVKWGSRPVAGNVNCQW